MQSDSTPRPSDDDVRRTLFLLINLIREEYPDTLSLHEIVDTWTSATAVDLAVLDRVESWLYRTPQEARDGR